MSASKRSCAWLERLDDESENADEHASDSAADAEDVANAGGDDKASAPKPAKLRPRRQLPDHLERVRVTHELDEEHRCGECGAQLMPIGEEVTEQIGVIPARQFVIQHVKIKYACACKECGVKTALMPLQPLPGSQASPSILACTMMVKLLDALPLYRQEKIWAREKLDWSRSKLDRWLIDSASFLQPLDKPDAGGVLRLRHRDVR